MSLAEQLISTMLTEQDPLFGSLSPTSWRGKSGTDLRPMRVDPGRVTLNLHPRKAKVVRFVTKAVLVSLKATRLLKYVDSISVDSSKKKPRWYMGAGDIVIDFRSSVLPKESKALIAHLTRQDYIWQAPPPDGYGSFGFRLRPSRDEFSLRIAWRSNVRGTTVF